MAKIRNWSLQTAVPKAPGKSDQNTNIINLSMKYHMTCECAYSLIAILEVYKASKNMKGLLYPIKIMETLHNLSRLHKHDMEN